MSEDTFKEAMNLKTSIDFIRRQNEDLNEAKKALLSSEKRSDDIIKFVTRLMELQFGDYVFEDGRAYICIPKELKDEFSDGWLHRKNDDSIEPFVIYYEQFAAKHADKIIQPTWFVKLITLLQ